MTEADERWRPVVGYEGYYEIGSLGRVRSVDRVVVDSIGRKYSYRGQLLSPVTNPLSGRDTVQLYRGGRSTRGYVHSLVLLTFVGPRPTGAVACHNNGDLTDNRLVNLRWDTISGNIRDAVRHGTHPYSRRNRCKNGHLLQAPNLHHQSRPNCRLCLACRLTYGSAAVARRTGRPFDFEQVVTERYAQIMASA